MIVSLVGAHGVGKTTVGKLVAKRLGMYFIDLECIYDAHALSPHVRQLMFLSSFTLDFLKGVCKYSNVIFSSHPIMVPIYTEYWVNRKEAEYMYEIVSKLPKVDLMIVLHAPPQVIRERILNRGRPVVDEEANVDYIAFIQNRVLALVHKLRKLAKEVILVDTNTTLRKVVENVSMHVSKVALITEKPIPR